MVGLMYIYLLFKISFIIESILAEIGKKSLLCSNYFVYHHIVICITAWFGANYYPGGHISFMLVANGLVHVLMSLNFLIALLFPNLKQFTKKLKTFFEILMVRKKSSDQQLPIYW
jgi:GNS1/SUR4 family